MTDVRRTSRKFCVTPNQHAKPAGVELSASSAVFTGYQDFEWTDGTLRVHPYDQSLARKYALLAPVLRPALLSGRTVLDLGANSAFFSLLALQQGAAAATAVDLDGDYVRNVNRAVHALGISGLVAREHNVEAWRQPADVVIALALVHWLHSCTSAFDTLGAVVDHLSTLARDVLIVEWIEPSDPHIQFFGHIGWDESVDVGPYDRETFLAELSRHFRRIDRIGDVNATRCLYVAYKTPGTIDLRCPLPLRHLPDTVISCGLLTRHDGRDYWSRVYQLGDRIEKQTSGSLAAHEYRILTRLASADIPRPLAVVEDAGESRLVVERVEGVPFDRGIAAIAAVEARFEPFVEACLQILAHLRQAGVVHRDIHAHNLLIRTGRPVLIDFGWALAPGLDVFTPDGFEGGTPRTDVHAFGVLLRRACPQRSPLRPLLDLMAAADPAGRVEDLDVLRTLFDSLRGRHDASVTPGGTRHVVAALCAGIEHRDALAHGLRAELDAIAVRSTLEHPVERDRILALHATALDPRLAAHDVQAHIPHDLRDYALRYAASLRLSGRAADALGVVERVMASSDSADDGYRIALYMKGSIHREAGRDEAALDCFEAVLAMGLEAVGPAMLAGACYHSAILLDRLGDRPRACDRLGRCLELQPDHAAARALAAQWRS